MQSIPSDGDPLISVFGLDHAGYYLWLAPLLGAVFAVILMLMFIAGMLKGSVFPDFYLSHPGTEYGLAFFNFTWNTLPKSSEEYGKLFVWAFLAGFAERLVPDSLDRLSSKLDVGAKPTPQPLAPNSMPKLPEPPHPPLTPETLQNVLHTGEPPPGNQK